MALSTRRVTGCLLIIKYRSSWNIFFRRILCLQPNSLHFYSLLYNYGTVNSRMFKTIFYCVKYRAQRTSTVLGVKFTHTKFLFTEHFVCVRDHTKKSRNTLRECSFFTLFRDYLSREFSR
jgi:hypothetical protein